TNRVTGILSETRALTPDTALRLERFFSGTTAQFWLNLHANLDLRRAEMERAATSSPASSPTGCLPVSLRSLANWEIKEGPTCLCASLCVSFEQGPRSRLSVNIR